ncbi:hypothetical protein [Desulfoluna spongiiphila]|uniref:Roadblock/LC7 domain-containing protein n=1 Tax=Desulfoluna spongiiphila TaxID=419481 RepID=A0A1G5FNG9_9BACT|nr:hypothetical protein [Desulfoluna spongiiphila]SCY40825.1 hypothetical protein SAMN05216233_108179 [Desulfoluna spongiiphila]VVS95498.1 hypothetical protein DBB_50750 [Desulfoluna spongiiphila]
MANHFDDLFSIDGVQGVFYISDTGKPLVAELSSSHGDSDHECREAQAFLTEKMRWRDMAPLVDGATEGEILFDALRVYYRRTVDGILYILMAPQCVAAMVRMTCDLISTDIDKSRKSRGFGRFFKM